MDYNKIHDEALANASKGHNALDSAIKYSSSSVGGRSKDPMTSYEKKQDEDAMRSSIASMFQDLLSRSSNSITASDWNADLRMVESVHHFYYTYYSSNPFSIIFLGFLAFFIATSKFYIFAGVFAVISLLVLSGSNPKLFFELQTRHIRADRKFKDLVFQNIFKNQISFKNISILSGVFVLVSFFFLEFQVAIFGFNFFQILYSGYNQSLETYALFNALACFVVAYAKLKERWA
jgi:hypothetical protein